MVHVHKHPETPVQITFHISILVKILSLCYNLLQNTLSELSYRITCEEKSEDRLSCFRSLQFDLLAKI